jgi:UTP-glucose-1-phosphate uridylyltransferase/mevalonate kinase
VNIFVPGRICLFGEHSDWAAGHRRTNAEIEKGYTIIAGTNQGIHAEVKPHPSKLVLCSTVNDGMREGPFAVPLEPEALLAEAQRGGFFSYAAGVAYQILTHYRVRGLEIDNYKTDLPIKKGLSSSAAICVLVARAFNRLYDLKMTVRGEMEYAYLGEVTTPSRCGRMDQGCAYGNRPIMMTFNGDRMEVQELSVPEDLHFVVVDLRAGKDTREILNRLNRCYPFADSDVSKSVQEYLGPINARIAHEAADALRKGDAERVGALMREAQSEFDKHLQPACPSQLTAPALHKVLSFPPIQPYVLGGKGVGSGGDGSAQFVVKDEESQQQVIEIIERELQMPCLKLTLCAGRRVRKALIPAAGFGTRLFPATKALKKELFPIVDNSGRAKPVILAIVEEALSAGIEEVGIIVQNRDRELFEQVFFMPPPVENFNRLSVEDQQYCAYLLDVGHRVTFITQDAQDGFGHAVYSAREWVGDAAFLLMLGDHLYASESQVSCSRQLVEVYERVGQSVVGLKVTPAAAIHNFGCVAGLWEEPQSLLSVTEVHEKPSLEYAREHLHVEGVQEGYFLSLFGQYVLDSRIFEYLRELIGSNVREGGEFQLTPCLDRLRREEGMSGYVVKGERFDIGTPSSYREAVINYRVHGLRLPAANEDADSVDSAPP